MKKVITETYTERTEKERSNRSIKFGIFMIIISYTYFGFVFIFDYLESLVICTGYISCLYLHFGILVVGIIITLLGFCLGYIIMYSLSKYKIEIKEVKK